MPLGKFQCKECEHVHSVPYRGRGTEAAKNKECPECSGAVRYVFCPAAVKVDFTAGLQYGTGLDKYGQGVYFNSKREMTAKMAEKGLKIAT